MTSPEGQPVQGPDAIPGLLDSFVGLTALRDVEEILQRAVDIARLVTGARYGAAAALDGGISAFVHEGLTQTEVDALPHLPRGHGMLGSVIEAREPVRSDDLGADPRSIGFPLNHVPMKAFLGVPIQHDDRLRGALYLTKPPGHGSFSERDEFLMVKLAAQTAVALRTAALIEELENKNAIVELLERIAAASNQATGAEEAFRTTLGEICRFLQFPIGHVYMVRDTDEGTLESTRLWHLADEDAFAGFVSVTEAKHLKRGDGLPGLVLKNRKALWMEDVRSDARFTRKEAAESAGLVTAFAFPVMVDDQVAGVMEFFTTEKLQCDERVMDIGTHIGTQLGRVVERSRVEETLRELDVAKSEFVANAAHELRTPLTTVVGLTEILTNAKSSLSEEQVQESMRLLRRQGERIGSLLTSLLDYSRIEVRGADVELEALRLVDVVNRAVEIAPPPEPKAVSTAVDPQLEALGDPVRLEQVIVNLLTNAYRYGGDRITVTGAQVDGRPTLTVVDDGPGIDKTLLPHLFDPFTRGGSTGSVTGSGLGLAIVKRIVEALGGDISCVTTAPQGAEFQISLRGPGERSA